MKKAFASLFTAALVLPLSASVALADGYGTAGCGLGSIFFGDSPGFVQVLAATTNGSSGNQTFAISSGTSNCQNTGGGEQSAKAFIETNREALAKDIARGQGETISSLSTLAGCSDEGAVGRTLQSNFKSIFPNASVEDQKVSQSVVDTLKAHGELSCGRLG
ncbi:MAG: DUF3015 domain-containing protein [Myxococcales bacterium]|nr:DUF3015 domain-containing protein [Myxococcales bacterium]